MTGHRRLRWRSSGAFYGWMSKIRASAGLGATQQLPAGFAETGQFNLLQDRRLLVWLNFGAIPVFLVVGWAFWYCANLLRPELAEAAPFAATSFLQWVVLFFLILILHELVHGFFMALITGVNPKFGFRGLYAYVGAPDWYFTRGAYLLINFAPLVILTLAGLAAIKFATLTLIPAVLVAITINAAGAVSDLYVGGWVLRRREVAWIHDTGDVFTMFSLQEESAPNPDNG